MRCLQCNYDNEDIAKFCANCGTRLIERHAQIFRSLDTNKVGLRDADTGEIIIDPIHDKINDIGSSDITVGGYDVDTEEIIIDPKSDEITDIGDPITLKNGQFIFAKSYSSIEYEDFTETVYDYNGNIVIPGGRFHCIWCLHEISMFICVTNSPQNLVTKEYYAYDRKGNFLFKYKYIDIEYPTMLPYNAYLAAAKNNDGLYGYIDIRTGEAILEFKWEKACSFYSGLASVQDRHTKKWGLINTQGKILVPCEYYGRFAVFGRGLVIYEKHQGNLETTTLTDLLNKYK